MNLKEKLLQEINYCRKGTIDNIFLHSFIFFTKFKLVYYSQAYILFFK